MPAPFIRSKNTVQTVMVRTLIALAPLTLVWVWLFGGMVIVHIMVCLATALAAEIACLAARQTPRAAITHTIQDMSWAVCAIIIALAIPPYAPWMLGFGATLLAITLGKHAYGGLGQNIFNPAMVGYAMMLISFPEWFRYWPEVSLQGVYAEIDAYASATPLERWRYDNQPLAPTAWMWAMHAAIGLGGVVLYAARLIKPVIPIVFLASLAIFSWLIHGTLSGMWVGGAVFAAFFVLTDPVSSPSSARAILAYALIIALTTVLIRAWGRYPDGIAFAILFGNALAPLLDRLLPPTPKPRLGLWHRFSPRARRP